MNLNLLPREFLIKALLRRRLRQWSIVWAGCAVLLTTMLSLRGRELVAARDRTALVENRCQPIRQMDADNANLAVRITSLARKPQLMQGLDLANRALLLLGEVGRGTTQSDGGMQLLRLDLQTQLETTRPKSAASPVNGAPTAESAAVMSVAVSLHGMAFDAATVARFVTELREREALNKVKLKSSSSRPSPVGVLREYHVEGRL